MHLNEEVQKKYNMMITYLHQLPSYRNKNQRHFEAKIQEKYNFIERTMEAAKQRLQKGKQKVDQLLDELMQLENSQYHAQTHQLNEMKSHCQYFASLIEKYSFQIKNAEQKLNYLKQKTRKKKSVLLKQLNQNYQTLETIITIQRQQSQHNSNSISKTYETNLSSPQIVEKIPNQKLIDSINRLKQKNEIISQKINQKIYKMQAQLEFFKHCCDSFVKKSPEKMKAMPKYENETNRIGRSLSMDTMNKKLYGDFVLKRKRKQSEWVDLASYKVKLTTCTSEVSSIFIILQYLTKKIHRATELLKIL